MTLAQERAEASERRSLRELDAERSARQQSERTAEALRGELVAARSEARDAAVAQAEVRARLEAQAAALTDRLAGAEQAQRKAANDLDAIHAELAAAQRRAERAEAEAALARQLLAELRVGPPERNGGGGRRRKADGRAPTEQAAQSEKLDEQQEDKQGAPAGVLNPDGDSDSGDDSNDSKN